MSVQENQREVLMKVRALRISLVHTYRNNVIIRRHSEQERAASVVSTQHSRLSILHPYVLMTKANTLRRTYDKLFTFGIGLYEPILVAARSKAWVCGRSLAGIAGSSPAGGMHVCVL